jgi:PadR family transcriptional regulator, regulatory protein PadR
MVPPRLTTQTLTVLGAMLSAPEADWYGLSLSKCSGLKPGTIYPILDRLLKLGWLERRWEDIDPVAKGRPKRRLYRLTATGAPAARLALDAHIASLRRPRPAIGVRPNDPPRLVWPQWASS